MKHLARVVAGIGIAVGLIHLLQKVGGAYPYQPTAEDAVFILLAAIAIALTTPHE